MRLLLDTHIFLWWAHEPDRLPPGARAALEDPANRLILSVVSLWEIQVKTQLGKIRLLAPLSELVESQSRVNGLTILPVEAAHVFGLDALPPLHKDPFDRLLVAQANVEEAVLVTADPVLAMYPVRRLG